MDICNGCSYYLESHGGCFHLVRCIRVRDMLTQQPKPTKTLNILKPVTLKAVLETGDVCSGAAQKVYEYFFARLSQQGMMSQGLTEAHLNELKEEEPLWFQWLIDKEFIEEVDSGPRVMEGWIATVPMTPEQDPIIGPFSKSRHAKDHSDIYSGVKITRARVTIEELPE